MTTFNSNVRTKATLGETTTGTGTGIATEAGTKSRTNAMNACRLMDTVLSTPSLNQCLLSDSVQLFPDHILQEARHLRNTNAQSTSQRQDFNATMADLLSLVEKTRLEISEALSQNPSWKTASPSLNMDTSTLSAFDNTFHQLIRAMHAFQESYQQSNSSQHVLEYREQQQRNSHLSSEHDTVPGLGDASRTLRSTQEALLNMMENIRTVQETISLLTDPTSKTQRAISHIRRDLICGSGDPGVEEHLDRLYTMSATLERALQRK